MRKNLITSNKNSTLSLSRTKNLLNITNKLISKKKNELVDDSWIERLWAWADENDISKEYLPRDKEKLLNLKELDLYDNQLTELPKEISNLINLTKLNLSYNNLQRLPKTIKKLTNLIKLNLENNPMEEELPKEVMNLIKLKEINLCYTLISKIPKELFYLLSLEKIYYNTFADMYPIKELPKGINNLKNLKNFYFQSAGLKKMPKEIGSLTNLKELNLYDNQLIELPKEICNLTNLTFLCLSNNPNLILTTEQKEWIKELKNNGCRVSMDDDLLNIVDKPEIEINEDEIPF